MCHVVSTVIGRHGSTATFTAEKNSSVANTLRFFIQGSDVEAIQADGDPSAIYLRNQVKGRNRLTVRAFANDGTTLQKKINLSTRMLKVTIQKDKLQVEETNI